MNTPQSAVPARRLASRGLAVATVMATVLAAMPAGVAPAAAGERNWHGGGRGDVVRCGPHGRHCSGPRARPRHDDGDLLGAAVLGIIGGAIIAGALSNAAQNQPVYETPVHPRYQAPAPVYQAPAPVYQAPIYPPAPSGPQVITYAGSLEPWSQGWYEWCDARYRSFDPERGTYRGYDGRDHFCVPK